MYERVASSNLRLNIKLAASSTGMALLSVDMLYVNITYAVNYAIYIVM